jgi:hypothetical protein
MNARKRGLQTAAGVMQIIVAAGMILITLLMILALSLTLSMMDFLLNEVDYFDFPTSGFTGFLVAICLILVGICALFLIIGIQLVKNPYNPTTRTFKQKTGVSVTAVVLNVLMFILYVVSGAWFFGLLPLAIAICAFISLFYKFSDQPQQGFQPPQPPPYPFAPPPYPHQPPYHHPTYNPHPPYPQPPYGQQPFNQPPNGQYPPNGQNPNGQFPPKPPNLW